MRGILFSVAFVASVVAVGAAQAVTVESVEGRVLINRGAGYRTVNNSVEGAPGNRVLANANSRARIVYDNGCVVIVDPGNVITIAQAPPCPPGGGGTAGAGTAGGAAGAAGGLTGLEVAAGVAAVGAGAGAIIFFANRSSSP